MLSPSSSGFSSPSISTLIADDSSLNSRFHADEPVTDFSVRIFSSGSLKR